MSHFDRRRLGDLVRFLDRAIPTWIMPPLILLASFHILPPAVVGIVLCPAFFFLVVRECSRYGRKRGSDGYGGVDAGVSM
jgi:hypothetical protein